MTAIIEEDRCTACETCVDECPAQAITMNKDKANVNKEICVDCGSCVDVCPSEAIHLE
ncbi:MAG TPA: 4Fe-4S binding protein [Methanoregulaceae archaeon]|nr:4Fe-4S binding protein [Methanoregulaceae archaeon]